LRIQCAPVPASTVIAREIQLPLTLWKGFTLHQYNYSKNNLLMFTKCGEKNDEKMKNEGAI